MTEQELISAAKAPTFAYLKKDWGAVRAACTLDFVYDEVATSRNVRGVEEVLKVWKGWSAAFPETAEPFVESHVAGNKVILELRWRGKNTGPLALPGGREVPPTGKSMDLRACQILEIADGKVKSMRQYFDMASLLNQLGIKA